MQNAALHLFKSYRKLEGGALGVAIRWHLGEELGGSPVPRAHHGLGFGRFVQPVLLHLPLAKLMGQLGEDK